MTPTLHTSTAGPYGTCDRIWSHKQQNTKHTPVGVVMSGGDSRLKRGQEGTRAWDKPQEP